jgi:hypothetical protein
MNTKRALTGVLVAAGILILFCLLPPTHPRRDKARAPRITTVNAPPRLSMSFALSNTAAPANTLPSTAK